MNAHFADSIFGLQDESFLRYGTGLEPEHVGVLALPAIAPEREELLAYFDTYLGLNVAPLRCVEGLQ